MPLYLDLYAWDYDAHSPFTVSVETATYTTTVHIVDYIKLLEDDYCMVLFDSCHRHRSVKILRGKDRREPVAETLRTRAAHWIDVKSITPARVVKLSKTVNVSTPIVRRKMTSADIM